MYLIVLGSETSPKCKFESYGLPYSVIDIKNVMSQIKVNAGLETMSCHILTITLKILFQYLY